MEYKAIRSNGDIDQVIHNGEVLWSKVITLSPSFGKGDRSNRILIDIDVPTNKKGFASISVDYDWLLKNEVIELEFKLSDYRGFGWMAGNEGLSKKYGSNDGIFGDPASSIKIRSLDEPISNIKINVIFNRSVTEADIKNIKVTAEYVMEE